MNNLINSIELKDIPVLCINNRTGRTDYIDFITSEDMTHNVMRGRDCYNRPFLAVKVNIQPPTCHDVSQSDPEYKDEEKYRDTSMYEAVGTFFQRYADSHSALAFGTCYAQNMIYDDSRIRSNIEIDIIAERINMLLRGETVFDYDFWRYNDYRTERPYGNGTHKIWMQPRKELMTKPLDVFTYTDIKKCVQSYF